MASRHGTVEQKIASIASTAHGIVTRKELLRAGISSDEIQTRRERGALIDMYPGVYRVGHAAPGVEADYTAAVKAGGEGAVIFGSAAAYLLGPVRGPAPPAA